MTQSNSVLILAPYYLSNHRRFFVSIAMEFVFHHTFSTILVIFFIQLWVMNSLLYESQEVMLAGTFDGSRLLFRFLHWLSDSSLPRGEEGLIWVGGIFT